MKLRDRIAVGFCLSLVVVTVLFVVDMQNENERRSFASMTGYRSGGGVGTHGRSDQFVREPPPQPPGRNSNAQPSMAPKMKGIHSGGTTTVPGQQQEAPVDNYATDDFDDLTEYMHTFIVYKGHVNDWTQVAQIIVDDTDENGVTSNEDVASLFNLRARKNDTKLAKFHLRISKREMYPANDSYVPMLLKEMSKSPIKKVDQKEGGTQLKLIMEFFNGDKALMKPMRFPREQQTLPNHFYFTDYERHNAEIAAFHLDRVMEFRRAMPVSGRLMNITTEIMNLVSDEELLKTFFVSPARNLCFHGHCSYYCDTSHAICGNPDMLEGSLAAYLPSQNVLERKTWRHPWRRSYHKRKKAKWETDANYCDLIRQVEPYNTGRRLLDMMDLSVFDFLMGNMDRHHYETFVAFGNDSFPIHLDHGRAFGKPFHDEMSILAPIAQCCHIRKSTLEMLLRFHNGKKLSEYLEESMNTDPLAPILWQPHLEAVDRRVGLVLAVVRACINHLTTKVDRYDSQRPVHSADGSSEFQKILQSNLEAETVTRSEEIKTKNPDSLDMPHQVDQPHRV
ncbi:extracellular serine/threonine protein CG31145 [Adelges cooleyi]|uniref:extracellular serine/threonine protein CG31145 n=1 Tax=Adelges cooleyi TaxID=133065 RepID=UPI00217FFB1E|nr:extracellular serine/threonine protein CG31145 [Adelges cooleyi]